MFGELLAVGEKLTVRNTLFGSLTPSIPRMVMALEKVVCFLRIVTSPKRLIVSKGRHLKIVARFGDISQDRVIAPDVIGESRIIGGLRHVARAHTAGTMPVVRWEMGLPERIIMRVAFAMPCQMLGTWGFRLAGFTVAIFPIGAQLQHIRVAHLLQPPRHVARAQVGFKDNPAASATFTLIGPAVFGNDPVKVLLEISEGGAALHGAGNGGLKIRQHGEIGGPGNNKGAVMGAAQGIGPRLGRLAPLLGKEVNLLLERLVEYVSVGEAGVIVLAVSKRGLASMKGRQLQAIAQQFAKCIWGPFCAKSENGAGGVWIIRRGLNGGADGVEAAGGKAGECRRDHRLRSRYAVNFEATALKSRGGSTVRFLCWHVASLVAINRIFLIES